MFLPLACTGSLPFDRNNRPLEFLLRRCRVSHRRLQPWPARSGRVPRQQRHTVKRYLAPLAELVTERVPKLVRRHGEASRVGNTGDRRLRRRAVRRPPLSPGKSGPVPDPLKRNQPATANRASRFNGTSRRLPPLPNRTITAPRRWDRVTSRASRSTVSDTRRPAFSISETRAASRAVSARRRSVFAPCSARCSARSSRC